MTSALLRDEENSTSQIAGRADNRDDDEDNEDFGKRSVLLLVDGAREWL